MGEKRSPKGTKQFSLCMNEKSVEHTVSVHDLRCEIFGGSISGILIEMRALKIKGNIIIQINCNIP